LRGRWREREEGGREREGERHTTLKCVHVRVRKAP